MKEWLLVLVVVVVMAGFQSVCAQKAEIVNEIWPEVQMVGRTGRLNCTIARLKPADTVLWSLLGGKTVKGKTISVQSDIVGMNRKLGGKFKYEIVVTAKGDRVTYTLIVRHLVQTDAGQYKCSIRVTGSTVDQTSKLGNLTVQVSPTISGDADAVKEVDMKNNATLKCTASGIPFPNITWTRSDGGLLPILPTPRAQFRGVDLDLQQIKIHHMGVYRCVADNNIKPPAEHLCEVLVFHPPYTRVVQNSVGQAKNRRLSSKLECIVQGHPVPTVTWWRMVGSEKKYIIDDDRYAIHKQTQDNQNLRAMEQWYTLKIKNVQSNDYTTYICEGSNKMGNHSSSIVLFETTECQGANCPSLSATGDAFRTVPNASAIILLFLIVSVCLRRS